MDEKEQLRASELTEKTERIAEGRTAGLVRRLLLGMMYGLWGYLLGGATLPFGAAPFGIALLAVADARGLYVLAGLCLGALQSENGIFLLSVYGALLALRLLGGFLLDLPARLRRRSEEMTLGEVTPHLLREHVSLRMASAAVAAFAVGIRGLMAGGFLYYDLYGTLLSVIVAPVAVLLLAGFFRGERERISYFVGFLALGTMLSFAAEGLKLYGVSLGAFGAMSATLYVSRRRGAVMGALTGTLFGLAIAPSLAPLFAFGALVFGVLFPRSVALGCLASFGVSLGWGYYVQGLGVLNGLFSALLASHLLFGVWERLFLREQSRNLEKEEEKTEEAPSAFALTESNAERDFLRLSDAAERIHALCGGFAELGELFDAMARRMQRPDRQILRQICDRAFDGSCTSCPSKEDCWGVHDMRTASEVDELCALLYGKGRVRREEVVSLGERCSRLPDILEEINQNAARYEAELLATDRTELFASDFRVMSRLLAGVMSEEDRAYETDSDAAQRLSEALGDGRSVCVMGQRRKRIALCGEGLSSPEERERLRILAEETLGLCLTEESLDEERGLLVLVEEPRLKVRYALRQERSPSEEIFCGDTAEAFTGRDGRFFGFISDGMGAGEAAATTSASAGLFLGHLLRAGGGCEEVLELLNGFLRSRGGGSLRECSATVDLLDLDLMEGRATFYKSGAAPTYVLRNGGLFKIKARTVPMGIIREPDVQKLSFTMSAGDLAVMVSDGVTQGKEECPWLFDLLRSHGANSDPDRLADRIVKYAKERGSTDDISVLVTYFS